jgi:hypothetical protein
MLVELPQTIPTNREIAITLKFMARLSRVLGMLANGRIINVIDIKKIKTLEYIKKEGNMLKIGACTRLTQILEWSQSHHQTNPDG